MSEVASSWLSMLTPPPPKPKPKRANAARKPLSKEKTDKARAICTQEYAQLVAPPHTTVLQRLIGEAKMNPTTARSFLEDWRNKQIPPR